MEMGELTEEQANAIVTQAEAKAQEAEQAAALERRRQREQQRIDAATAAAEAAEAAELERRVQQEQQQGLETPVPSAEVEVIASAEETATSPPTSAEE